MIYEIIWAVVERNATPDELVRTSGTHDEITEVYRVATYLLTWDEQRALDACPDETRELLDAWADAGRVGEAAAAMIEHRLRPAALDAALRRTHLDEATLLAWLSSLGGDLDDDTIDFITAWRVSGLPDNPPPGADRFHGRDPAELQTWLDAGFDLYAASQLEHAGLATAMRWREAGFDEADTYELLRSDPALTPTEALAFDDAGLACEQRQEWIYYGFTAAQATDWAAAGLKPSEARLWRACGQQADDVEPGRRIPPQLVEGRRYIGLSGSQWDDLPDPPGTRGRRARRWAGDDHPWINTD